MHLSTAGVNTGKAYTWTAQHVFTALPTGTTVDKGSVYINPASANADEILFGVALNGSSRFRVDEDGDVVVAGDANFGGSLSFENGALTIQKSGAYARILNYQDSGFLLKGASLIENRVTMGSGATDEIDLTGNLDQDDVLIKRDVDGGSSYSEGGANLVLQRDVTNVTAEGGNFLENQNAAGVILSRFDASGHLILNELIRVREDNGGKLYIRNLADSGFVTVSCGAVISTGYVQSQYQYAQYYHDQNATGYVLQVGGRRRTTDAAPGTVTIAGQLAFATATSNKVGGTVDIYGGTGDGAAAQTAAHGGQLSLHGGIAASDLASSNGGDVLIYGGAHSSTGNEGSMKIVNADGTTAIAAFNESKIGFFSVAAAPVTQRAKADYNNWAAFGDVVNALVALGLFDAA